jgi:hypothetical protein
LSYVYCAAGLNVAAPSDTVFAYEPLQNHAGAGTWAILVDGRAKYISAAQIKVFVVELESGHDPPRAEMVK